MCRNSIGTGVGAVLVGLAALLLAGCASTPDWQKDSFYAPTLPPADNAPAPSDGAIYHSFGGLALFADPKARRVGDILTINLVEQTDASKKSSTSTKKGDSADLGGVHILGRPVTRHGTDLLNAGFKGDRKFDGGGSSSESNSLSGSITVTVAKRLSNGNLIVRGKKWLQLNQGSEYVRISGIVRPQDIGPNNEVASTRVANARIAYTGKGVLNDANSMGWLAKFFNSPLTPF
jgi:flagellar L-ring protein precursor FlgH